MRITIDIDANELKQIQTITGEKKKSPAIVQALSRFLRQQQRQKFLERALSGQTDFSLSNDELEALDIYETH
jgi:Arc/MetJ family transcription regulator